MCVYYARLLIKRNQKASIFHVRLLTIFPNCLLCQNRGHRGENLERAQYCDWSRRGYGERGAAPRAAEAAAAGRQRGMTTAPTEFGRTHS